MASHKWVLIIDDEDDLARLMKTVLHKEGIADVVTAGTLQRVGTSFRSIILSLYC